jgi:hypothetical protein
VIEATVAGSDRGAVVRTIQSRVPAYTPSAGVGEAAAVYRKPLGRRAPRDWLEWGHSIPLWLQAVIYYC